MGQRRSLDIRQQRERRVAEHTPAALALTVTVEQAANILGISRTSAYACVARNEIPTVRLGRRVVVPTARLMALLDNGERDATRRSAAAATEQLTLQLN